MILTLENRGSITHPRYVLMNSYGFVYCEERDMFVEMGGTLYHDVNPATTQMRQLLLAEHVGEPVRRFTAPIILDLYTTKDVDQATIEDWCLKATRLILHADQHGMGPVNESLGLISVNWAKLREIGTECDQ